MARITQEQYEAILGRKGYKVTQCAVSGTRSVVPPAGLPSVVLPSVGLSAISASECVKTQTKAVAVDSGKRVRVARTRNGATLTEAAFWSKVRSALRLAFRWWKPGLEALKRAKVGKLYLCADCGKLFPRKSVEIDHVVQVGSLRCSADLAAFLERLTPESPDAYKIRCCPCHQAKTNADRAGTR